MRTDNASRRSMPAVLPKAAREVLADIFDALDDLDRRQAEWTKQRDADVATFREKVAELQDRQRRGEYVAAGEWPDEPFVAIPATFDIERRKLTEQALDRSPEVYDAIAAEVKAELKPLSEAVQREARKIDLDVLGRKIDVLLWFNGDKATHQQRVTPVVVEDLLRAALDGGRSLIGPRPPAPKPPPLSWPEYTAQRTAEREARGVTLQPYPTPPSPPGPTGFERA